MEILRDLSVSKSEEAEITVSNLRVSLREKERERERERETQGSECLREKKNLGQLLEIYRSWCPWVGVVRECICQFVIFSRAVLDRKRQFVE